MKELEATGSCFEVDKYVEYPVGEPRHVNQNKPRNLWWLGPIRPSWWRDTLPGLARGAASFFID
jgi:hypothetical protein